MLPCFAELEVPALRILSDRGTEFRGNAEQHEDQLYLAINDVAYTKTKAASPPTCSIYRLPRLNFIAITAKPVASSLRLIA
ncbi:MAG: hypothetical protein ACOY3E_13195 [Pseudomonadota bacterium]